MSRDSGLDTWEQCGKCGEGLRVSKFSLSTFSVDVQRIMVQLRELDANVYCCPLSAEACLMSKALKCDFYCVLASLLSLFRETS